MVTVVHVYNRFHSSEIRCFVNGKVVSTGETTLVHANEVNIIYSFIILSVAKFPWITDAYQIENTYSP